MPSTHTHSLTLSLSRFVYPHNEEAYLTKMRYSWTVGSQWYKLADFLGASDEHPGRTGWVGWWKRKGHSPAVIPYPTNKAYRTIFIRENPHNVNENGNENKLESFTFSSLAFRPLACLFPRDAHMRSHTMWLFFILFTMWVTRATFSQIFT